MHLELESICIASCGKEDQWFTELDNFLIANNSYTTLNFNIFHLYIRYTVIHISDNKSIVGESFIFLGYFISVDYRLSIIQFEKSQKDS